jgi:hypothetical protein
MRAQTLALLSVLLVAGAAGAQDLLQQRPAASIVSGAHTRARAGHLDGLEQRVRLLTRELDLTAVQQEAVRQILQDQRESVQHLWHDSEIAPAERAPALRLIGERTADRIRAVLDEEQKKKYNRPVPEGALSAQASADVEGWLRATQGHSRENPLGVSLPAKQ